MNADFQNWIDGNLQSQKGKSFVITGGNSGIGFHAAMALAKVGGDVTILGRSEERIGRAVQDIKDEGIEGTIEGGIVDLGSLKSVKSCAETFREGRSGLDVLINNAGVMMPPPELTEDGFESQFAVNFLGHFALTGRLFDLLSATDGARVVTLSSIAHRGAHVDFDNLRLEKEYQRGACYSQSKLAETIFSLELGRRVDAKGGGLLSVGCHPGFTKTELQRNMDPGVLSRLTLMDTWQGCLPSLMAATGPDVKQGDFFGPDGPGETGGFPALGVIDGAALDLDVAKRLWDVGQDATGLTFP